MNASMPVKVVSEAQWRAELERLQSPDPSPAKWAMMRKGFGKEVRLLLPPREDTDMVCGSLVWEVHPEDATRIGWGPGASLCRHAFEAD